MMTTSSLPLLDLHRHLDGNIRPQTIWQLAEKNHIQLPTDSFEDFLPHVMITHNQPDLVSFLKKLDWGVKVLKTLDDCYRVAFENVEDAKNAGLDYAELRFSPYYMAMTHQLNVTDVVAAVVDGVTSASTQFNMPVKLIGILSRTFGAHACQQELDALLAHKQYLVAIDLAGDELNNPGELFISHFSQVKKADLQVTIHAGEAAGSESVWQAIKQLGASRIGHGVATIHDAKLMDYMVNNNISIESCLTSNLQTGTVQNLAEHPIKTFLAHGINVCLNTDDPAVEGIEIKHEFELAKTQLGFNEHQIEQLKLNALNAAFISMDERKTLISSLQTNGNN